jgi:hypothetical protein
MAVLVVWDGADAVEALMESGETFLIVQPGNQITLREAGAGYGVEMDIFFSGTNTLL